jgi:hypothetical protein
MKTAKLLLAAALILLRPLDTDITGKWSVDQEDCKATLKVMKDSSTEQLVGKMSFPGAETDLFEVQFDSGNISFTLARPEGTDIPVKYSYKGVLAGNDEINGTYSKTDDPSAKSSNFHALRQQATTLKPEQKPNIATALAAIREMR